MQQIWENEKTKQTLKLTLCCQLSGRPSELFWSKWYTKNLQIFSIHFFRWNNGLRSTELCWFNESHLTWRPKMAWSCGIQKGPGGAMLVLKKILQTFWVGWIDDWHLNLPWLRQQTSRLLVKCHLPSMHLICKFPFILKDPRAFWSRLVMSSTKEWTKRWNTKIWDILCFGSWTEWNSPSFHQHEIFETFSCGKGMR